MRWQRSTIVNSWRLLGMSYASNIEVYPGKNWQAVLRPDCAYFLDCLQLLFDQGGL
jgi:hypothetical protein